MSFIIVTRASYFDVNFFRYVAIHSLFIEIDEIDTSWKILLRNHLRLKKFFALQVTMSCARLSSEVAEIVITKCSSDSKNET